MKKYLVLGSFLFLMVITTNPVNAVYEGYVDVSPTPVGITSQSQAAQTELDRVVGEMISAGHMAPTYYYMGVGEAPAFYYLSPADTVYALSIAYPYVSQPLQAPLKQYIDNEIASYPPLSTRNYDQTTGRVANMAGARREYFTTADSLSYNVWPGPEIYPWTIYSVWAYSYYTNDWTYAQNNYTQIKNLYDQLPATISSYPDIAAVIGFARIANQLGQSADYTAAKTRAETALTAGVNFTQFVQNAQSTYPLTVHHYYSPIFMVNNHFKVFHFDRDIEKFLNEQASSQVAQYRDRLATESPFPWVTQSNFASGYGENNYTRPDVSWTYFMLSATAGSDKAQLKEITDLPDRKGDLFYIQKLVATIEAPDSSTQPSPNPTTCPTDLNGDSLTDLSDYSILANNFLTTNSVADINTDGIVDLTDYSQIAKNFLKTCN